MIGTTTDPRAQKCCFKTRSLKSLRWRCKIAITLPVSSYRIAEAEVVLRSGPGSWPKAEAKLPKEQWIVDSWNHFIAKMTHTVFSVIHSNLFIYFTFQNVVLARRYTYFKKGCHGDSRIVNRERQLHDQKDSWVFEISHQTGPKRQSHASTNVYRARASNVCTIFTRTYKLTR